MTALYTNQPQTTPCQTAQKSLPILASFLFILFSYPHLHIETEVHNVSVLHDVLLAFQAQLSALFDRAHRAGSHQVIIGYNFSANEPALEVRVNNSSRTRRFRS